MFEVILHGRVAAALFQQFEILAYEARPPVEQEGDLAGLQAALGQLGAAGERANIICNRLRRVMKDAADLSGGFSVQGEADDFDAMSQDRADIADGAAQWQWPSRLGMPQAGEVS